MNSPLEVERLYRDGFSMGSGVKVADTKLQMIRDKSHRVEKLLRDNFSMDSEGQGRRKEKKGTRTTWYEERYNNRSPATAPESLLGILAS